MIRVVEINDAEFDTLIEKFNESTNFLQSQFNIELKNYGNFLRILLNNIQPDSLNYLIERIYINRELEKALDNVGGYTIDILGDNNPKTRLIEIIKYLQTNPLKFIQLNDLLNDSNEKERVTADTNDIDYLNHIIRNHRVKIISFAELKRNIDKYSNLVMYSFNGKKDFDFIYNLKADISLVLFSQEHQLYKSQLQKRKQFIEEEVSSDERKNICGISYEFIPDLPIYLNQTIENIVNRLDGMDKKAYENYKEETDILLEEIEEKIIYKTTFSNHETKYLESNESIFNADGDLIKFYRIKVGDRVRIYPSEHFAEMLYKVAVETEKDVFGKVEEHSKYWLEHLIGLKKLYSDSLYIKLKESGLRVLPATVEGYFKGHRKFPMYNNDLKAIFKLCYPEKGDAEIDLLLAPIRKSKSTYNSTMIALGRGIKQEMKLFLRNRRIGEILSKLKFTSTTLQTFIDEYMPLLEIISKDVYTNESGQIELNLIQQIEL